MEKEKTYYETEIKTLEEQYNSLEKDKNALEKFAREEYFLHRSNEILLKIEEKE